MKKAAFILAEIDNLLSAGISCLDLTEFVWLLNCTSRLEALRVCFYELAAINIESINLNHLLTN